MNFVIILNYKVIVHSGVYKTYIYVIKRSVFYFKFAKFSFLNKRERKDSYMV